VTHECLFIGRKVHRCQLALHKSRITDALTGARLGLQSTISGAATAKSRARSNAEWPCMWPFDGTLHVFSWTVHAAVLHHRAVAKNKFVWLVDNVVILTSDSIKSGPPQAATIRRRRSGPHRCRENGVGGSR
jgi:hypothetical protein